MTWTYNNGLAIVNENVAGSNTIDEEKHNKMIAWHKTITRGNLGRHMEGSRNLEHSRERTDPKARTNVLEY